MSENRFQTTDGKFMKELGETLTPGTSAMFVLVDKATPDEVLEGLKGFKDNVLKTSLTRTLKGGTLR